MILFSPINGQVYQEPLNLKIKHIFIMTSLGKLTPELIEIRKVLNKLCLKFNYVGIDAGSSLSGGDYLDKIWKDILAVPICIAIITQDMSYSTVGNIFYELGIADTLGKETLLIKTNNCSVPSDLTRTEYLKFNDDFESGMNKFFDKIEEKYNHYYMMSSFLSAQPMLSIDYLRRAYLLSGDIDCKIKAQKVYNENYENIDKTFEINIGNFIKD